jgi:S-adenosylmethionine:tRNA ribosyltransferase-isomerase
VGTTTLKTLETVYSRHGTLKEDHGNSDMFIYPPYKFKTPASFFLTNFHLPKSTLIMMIAAYAGREKVLHAYREAVEREYRFYSFGDAMLIRG